MRFPEVTKSEANFRYILTLDDQKGLFFIQKVSFDLDPRPQPQNPTRIASVLAKLVYIFLHNRSTNHRENQCKYTNFHQMKK